MLAREHYRQRSGTNYPASRRFYFPQRSRVVISAECLEALTLPHARLAGRRVFVASERQTAGPCAWVIAVIRDHDQRFSGATLNVDTRGRGARRRGLPNRRLGNRRA